MMREVIRPYVPSIVIAVSIKSTLVTILKSSDPFMQCKVSKTKSEIGNLFSMPVFSSEPSANDFSLSFIISLRFPDQKLASPTNGLGIDKDDTSVSSLILMACSQ